MNAFSRSLLSVFFGSSCSIRCACALLTIKGVKIMKNDDFGERIGFIGSMMFIVVYVNGFRLIFLVLSVIEN